MRIYRALLHLYPRKFRVAYGDDMLALLRSQMQDEHRARVVGRAALDLVVTVPSRHLEARMPRSTPVSLIVVFVAVAAASATFGGPFGLAAAIALVVIAALIWRRGRPVVGPATSRWWKLLLAGIALLGTLVVVTTITGELPDGAWFLAMAAMLTSFALIGTGIVLGIAGRYRSLRRA